MAAFIRWIKPAQALSLDTCKPYDPFQASNHGTYCNAKRLGGQHGFVQLRAR
jgi:hypothetical protein